MSDSASETVVLVGPGRAGRALARSWTRAGGKVVVIARDAAAFRRDSGDLSGADVRSLDDGRDLAGDVLVLAVPDDAIEPLATALAPRSTCRVAFHLSGALSGRALAPLSPGASVGSLHPLRAFSGSPEESWKDAFVAVEGDEAAVDVGSRVCRRMDARPRRLAVFGKPLYHCAATLAAGGVASLLSMAARIWSEAGLAEKEGRIELAKLAVSAAEGVGRLPFAEALTGPVARRDLETVRLHREALAGRSDLARVYALLAAETLRRTPGRGREAEIARLFDAGKVETDSTAPSSGKKPDTYGPKG